ncbi:hypothetical protein D3C80_1135530 [compost metagenome]
MTFLGGRARPMPAKAPRTRSRLSATALSGRPTMAKAPAGVATCCTSTSTRRASTPSKATVTTRATMSSLPQTLGNKSRTRTACKSGVRSTGDAAAQAAAFLASITSHMRSVASTPANLSSCCAPVGEVTLISVR